VRPEEIAAVVAAVEAARPAQPLWTTALLTGLIAPVATLLAVWLTQRNARTMANDKLRHDLLIDAARARRAWRENRVKPLLDAIDKRLALHMELGQALAEEDSQECDRLSKALMDQVLAHTGHVAVDDDAFVEARLAFIEMDDELQRIMEQAQGWAPGRGELPDHPGADFHALGTDFGKRYRKAIADLHRVAEDYVNRVQDSDTVPGETRRSLVTMLLNRVRRG
jgi:hypothetical protein